MDKAPEILEPALNMLEALTYVTKEDKQNERKVNVTRDYALGRVVEVLHIGGYGRVFAKRMATVLMNEKARKHGDVGAIKDMDQGAFYKRATETFEKDCVVYLMDGAGDEQHRKQVHIDFIDGLATKAAENIKKKIEDITNTLARKKDWLSGMAKLDITLDQLPDICFPDAAPFAADPGGAPWLVGLRPNCWRYGPMDHPLPGMAQYIRAHNTDMVVHTFKVEPLVAEGLTLPDIHEFLESSSGAEWVKDNSVSVILKANDTLFVPYGVVPALTYYNSQPKDCYVHSGHIHRCMCVVC